MQRWTVRNVSADAIRAVQELSGDSGVCLGQIVSEAIERGLGQVRARLQATGTASAPAPKVSGGLDEVFRSIKLLSDGLPRATRK
jgi:hypothetical protein